MQCICGNELKQPPEGRPRKYCSDACKQLAYRSRLVTKLDVDNVTKLRKPDFYFSGIEKAATAQILVKEAASGMMSQLLYRESLIAACQDITLVMDSGAYTKALTKADIEAYAAIISRLGKRCVWYANADKIGDQEQSNQNYAYLCSLLPEHLRARILWIYQVSAPISYLHQALLQHQRIGIGGLVPLFQSPDRTLAYRKLREIAALIAKTDVLPHYFGVSIPQAVQELHGYHRAFTVDSTTWLIGGKYGLLVDRGGKQRPQKELGYDFTTEELLRQNVRTIKKWMETPVYHETTEYGTQLSWLEAV